MKSLNEDIICYLTPKAQDTVKSLIATYNMDFDLAIEMAARMMKEEECWELPEQD